MILLPREQAVPELGRVFPAALTRTMIACRTGRSSERPLLDEVSLDGYSAMLSSAGEDPLIRYLSADDDTLALRLIWLLAFHEPIIVRVVGLSDGTAKLAAKRVSLLLAQGDSYESEQETARPLSEADFSRLTGLLKTSKLLDQQSGSCDVGLDGSFWIIEAVGRDGYRFIERWSPQEGPMREVGLALLDLTGWKFEEVY